MADEHWLIRARADTTSIRLIRSFVCRIATRLDVLPLYTAVGAHAPTGSLWLMIAACSAQRDGRIVSSLQDVHTNAHPCPRAQPLRETFSDGVGNGLQFESSQGGL
jgi:hypothetical protein